MVDHGNAADDVPGMEELDPLLGCVISDRFKVIERIARGGMSTIYRGEQQPLGRQVAIKVLKTNFADGRDPEFHKRFILEASIHSKLSHPNTVTIFDFGKSREGIYYIAMEMLEGRTLYRALREDKTFEPKRAIHVASQIARSLREAHGIGVVHRDLKPSNIFLTHHGEEGDFVKVLDFGLVKNVVDGQSEEFTQAGLVMGSPKYMSPEQIQGHKVDGRSDIYAVGVMLYEMLTGIVPFDKPSPASLLMAHVHENVPPFELTNPEVTVPDVLQDVVFRTLAKHPDDRHLDTNELLEALSHAEAEMALGRASLPTASGRFARGVDVDVMVEGDARVRGEPASDTGPTAISDSPLDPGLDASVPAERPPIRRSAAPKKTKKSRSYLLIFVMLLAAGGVGTLVARWESVMGRARTESGSITAEGPHTGTKVGAPAAEDEQPQPTDHAAEPAGEAVVHETGAEGPTRMLSLRSNPPGASVTIGGREYGPTPADVEWSSEASDRGTEVTMVFEKRGYLPLTVTRTLRSETLTVTASLVPSRRARPRRAQRAAAKDSLPAPEAEPKAEETPSETPPEATAAEEPERRPTRKSLLVTPGRRSLSEPEKAPHLEYNDE